MICEFNHYFSGLSRNFGRFQITDPGTVSGHCTVDRLRTWIKQLTYYRLNDKADGTGFVVRGRKLYYNKRQSREVRVNLILVKNGRLRVQFRPSGQTKEP